MKSKQEVADGYSGKLAEIEARETVEEVAKENKARQKEKKEKKRKKLKKKKEKIHKEITKTGERKSLLFFGGSHL